MFPERSVWEQRSLHLQDLASRRSLRCCQHLGIRRSWRCFQSLVSQNLQLIQSQLHHVQMIGFQRIRKYCHHVQQTALGKRTEILAEPIQKKKRRMARTAFQSRPNLNVSLILIHLPTWAMRSIVAIVQPSYLLGDASRIERRRQKAKKSLSTKMLLKLFLAFCTLEK